MMSNMGGNQLESMLSSIRPAQSSSTPDWEWKERKKISAAGDGRSSMHPRGVSRVGRMHARGVVEE